MSCLQSVWLLAALWVCKGVLVCLKKASLIYRLHLYFRKEFIWEREHHITKIYWAVAAAMIRHQEKLRVFGVEAGCKAAGRQARCKVYCFRGNTCLFLPLRANCAGTKTSEPSWSFNGFLFLVFILQSADSLHSPRCLPCFYLFAVVAVWSRDAAKQSGSKLCSHQTNPVQQRAGKTPHTCGGGTPEREDADSLTDEWRTSCSRFKSVDDLWARCPGVGFYLLDKQASKNEGDLCSYTCFCFWCKNVDILSFFQEDELISLRRRLNQHSERLKPRVRQSSFTEIWVSKSSVRSAFMGTDLLRFTSRFGGLKLTVRFQ